MTSELGDELGSSFRDPDGFMFRRQGVLLRRIHRSYEKPYAQLMSSGLYAALVEAKLLVAHEEVPVGEAEESGASALTRHDRESQLHKIIRPEEVPFVSYPYEWSFSQLQDAALLCLRVQKMAVDKGMSLKDASAYNVQFLRGQPVHIDTLSFETLREGQPWVAYRQFCQHFLAPLALMSACDASLNQLLRVHLDGVPLDVASRLLPRSTRLNFGLATHLHLHAAAGRRLSSTRPASPDKTRNLGRTALLGLLDSLESTVRGFKWREEKTTWGTYYNETNYDEDAMKHKRRLVGELLDFLAPVPKVAWDLGANTGLFSQLASEREMQTLSLDSDVVAVEKNYRACRERGEEHILPLVQDLTNPSPALGWENRERMSLFERGPADVALALALVHHLAISNNVPLGHIARFLSRLCAHLIIEWVPADDSQARRLLAHRVDEFGGYTQPNFEAAFSPCFSIERTLAIPGTKRTLYLLRKRS